MISLLVWTYVESNWVIHAFTSFFFPAPSRKWKQENVSTVSKHPSTFTEQTRSARTLKPSCLLSLSVQITALHPPSSLHYSWQRCRVCSWYLVVLMCLRHILYVGQDKVTRGLHCAGRPCTCTFNTPTHLFVQRRSLSGRSEHTNNDRLESAGLSSSVDYSDEVAPLFKLHFDY